MKLLLNPTQQQFSFIVPDMPQTDGIQKVSGFSRGFHHINSIRLGIRKENNYCVLYFYAYINKKTIEERMCKVSIGDIVTCTLTWDVIVAAKVKTKLSKQEYASYFVAPKFTLPIGYQLYPYFEYDGSNKRQPFEIDFV